MKRKGLLLLAFILLMGGLLSGCSLIKKENQVAADVPNPIVTIEMTSGKTMKLELYPQVALNTVSNFVTLAQEGYYDGLIFHRIIAGFMIQGGDPTGTGTGGPGHSIKGEFTENGFQNDLEHTPGVISMARSGDPDSAGSQFFIVHATAASLDGKYAAFGKIIDEESMDTLNEIATVKTDGSDRPLIEQKIKSITVDTGGYQYQVVKAP